MVEDPRQEVLPSTAVNSKCFDFIEMSGFESDISRKFHLVQQFMDFEMIACLVETSDIQIIVFYCWPVARKRDPGKWNQNRHTCQLRKHSC